MPWRAAKATSRTPRACSGSAGRRCTTCSSIMTCRADLRFSWTVGAALLLSAAASAVPAPSPLSEAVAALDRGDGIAAEVSARRALDAGAPLNEVSALLGEAELLQGD